MLFNSFSFMVFFPTVVCLYFLTPHASRWILILTASCVFYMAFIPQYIFLLLYTILVTYGIALWIHTHEGKVRRVFFIGGVLLIGTPLLLFKYFNFFNSNLAELARFLGWNYPIQNLSWVLPIGISFYTFQSLSYFIEVYRKRRDPERRLHIMACYILFFPQLVAGPIERPENLLPQFDERHSFDGQRVLDGLKLMVWGYFKKVVIADKIAILVEKVYSDPSQYTGIPLIVAVIFFGIQVYCDFSGYSDIAVGSAQVLGFRLMDNFNRPFAARNVNEFWRRWHISLMTWFRDYVYIPLGGNRVGRWRRYFNLLITFTLSGFWHGAGWGFVLWGFLNGLYLILSDLTRKIREKGVRWVGLSRYPRGHHAFQVLFGFLLFCFTLIPFRSKTLSDALYILTHLGAGLGDLKGIQMSLKSLYGLGLDRYELLVALIAIGIMELVQWSVPLDQMRRMFWNKPIYVRWAFYYLLLFFLIFFGEYQDHAFIYFQF